MLRPRRSVLASACAAALAAAALTACTTTQNGTGLRLGKPFPGTPVPQAIAFRDCTDALLSAGVKVPKGLAGTVRIGCGNLRVPLDYAHPQGTSITLAVVRVHTTQNTRTPARSLLFNPGGPGGSGIDGGLGVYGMLPASVARAYDLVAFDPRGVGESTPVRCMSQGAYDQMASSSPDLTTRSGVAAAERQNKKFADACREHVGSGLRYYNTVNTARDMDQIRQAVGDDSMNYLGFSYGTELGWTYTRLFTPLVRTIVLDGAVDPTKHASGGDSTTSLAQVHGFESAFDQFAAYCAKHSTACHGLTSARSTAERILAGARKTPLHTDSKRTLTEDLASTGILAALYSQRTWPRLAQAILAAARGDGSGLLALADRYDERSADGSYSNLQDANATISCNDTPRSRDVGPARILAAARDWARRFPLFGADAAASLIGCRNWQPDRTPVPAPPRHTPRPVLVVGNLHDPATPYAGAQALARALGNARLLTWNGEGHTSFLGGSTCVDRFVGNYLVTGAVPPDRTVCPR